MTQAATFRRWALAPARTAEELYPVELLLVTAFHRAVYDGKLRTREDSEAYEADLRRRARRARFRPGIEPALFDYAEGWWDELTDLRLCHRVERPVRDLALLRLLPQVTSVDLALVDADLAPLAALPRLETLTLKISGPADLAALGRQPALRALTLDLAEGGDVAALGALRGLQTLRLSLDEPWPAGLVALAELPRLESVYYRGNLLPWAEMPVLPAAHTLELQPSFHANTPLSSLASLAASSAVRTLEVGALARLAGAERFLSVETLALAGPFRDLAPLARLPRLAKLRLCGEAFEDLSPLIAPPRLRQLELNRQRGILLKPLYQATNLREVAAPHCEVIAEELERLNERLGRVDPALYALPAPRPLPPLRFIAYSWRDPDYAALPPLPPEPDARAAAYGDDPAPAKHEDRWMEQALQARLEEALAPGWGHVDARGGTANVVLLRSNDIERLDAVVDVARDALARARFRWDCWIHYDPDSILFDLEAPQTEAERKAEREAEWRETEERWNAHREELRREHLRRLGCEVPEEEDTPEEPDAAESDAEESAIPQQELCDEDDDAAPEKTGCIVMLEDSILWVHAGNAGVVGRYLGRAAEDWNTLPEPPALRPRRR